MIVSGVISLIFSSVAVGNLFLVKKAFFPSWAKFHVIVLITTVIWILVTFITKPENQDVLVNFDKKTQPGDPGWSRVLKKVNSKDLKLINLNKNWNVPEGILAILIGCVLIYGCLFATGYWIYGQYKHASIASILVIIAAFYLIKLWKKIRTDVL
jgi:SSS family solute:Na+ symporter